MPGAQRVRTWAADWSSRRHGNDGQAVTLRRRRIYILPTRFGLVLAALTLAMLLGSLNYGASLGFALTFLLAGMSLVAMHHCHNNLLAMTVRCTGAEPVFAGEEARFRIQLQNRTREPRFDIMIECDEAEDGPVDPVPESDCALHLHLATEKRGWKKLPRFSLSTRHPGSLFRAWTWINMDARCLVYPAPAPPGLPMPAGSDALGTRPAAIQEEDDFVGLRDAAPGDPPKRLAWKAFARSDQLLLKEFAGGAQRPCLFDWNDLPGLDTEDRLAQLTRWCLDAAELQRSFGLALPGRKIELGYGERHLHECLQALALYGIGE